MDENKEIPMMPEEPATVMLGQTVFLRLSEHDANAANVNRRRWDSNHLGNECRMGQVLPMIVTAVWSRECCNGQVILDGNDRLWVTSRTRGDQPGQWLSEADAA